MRWIGCIHCEKFWHDFMARTFAPLRTVLHRVLYGNQTVPNVSKEYETHQNVSLVANGVDRVCSLQKIPTRLRGMNFCTRLAHFALSVVTQPNSPKCTQIVWNAPKHKVSIQWGGSNSLLWKILTRLHGPNFCTTSRRFAPSFVRQRNSTKCTKIVRNAPKHEFRPQWGQSGVFVAKNYDATSWHELFHQFGPFCT